MLKSAKSPSKLNVMLVMLGFYDHSKRYDKVAKKRLKCFWSNYASNQYP